MLMTPPPSGYAPGFMNRQSTPGLGLPGQQVHHPLGTYAGAGTTGNTPLQQALMQALAQRKGTPGLVPPLGQGPGGVAGMLGAMPPQSMGVR